MTVRPLSSALKKKAEKEENEGANGLSEDLRSFKEWLIKQPHLHLVNPTNQWLLAFLRGGKFSLEKSKEKLDMYYTMKGIVPELFSNRDPMDPKIQEILELGIFLPLKKCDKEDSPRTCFMRLGIFNPTKYHLADLIKVALMTTEILMMEDDNFTVSGSGGGHEGRRSKHVQPVDSVIGKEDHTCFEKAMPIRVKENNFLNIPPGFETVFSIFKMFLGDKIKKRLHVHNKSYKGFYKFVPNAILPVEYGGEDGSIQELINYWKAKVESYRVWFLQQENTLSDESKRADNIPKNSAIVFWLKGSFRKLEVD